MRKFRSLTIYSILHIWIWIPAHLGWTLDRLAILLIVTSGDRDTLWVLKYIERSIEWLRDWLIEWVIYWVNKFFIERKSDYWVNERLINWNSDWLHRWVIVWLSDCVINWLCDWVIEWMNDWVFVWLSNCVIE